MLQVALFYSKNTPACIFSRCTQVNGYVLYRHLCWAVNSQLTKPLWEAVFLQHDSLFLLTLEREEKLCRLEKVVYNLDPLPFSVLLTR